MNAFLCLVTVLGLALEFTTSIGTWNSSSTTCSTSTTWTTQTTTFLTETASSTACCDLLCLMLDVARISTCPANAAEAAVQKKPAGHREGEPRPQNLKRPRFPGLGSIRIRSRSMGLGA